MTIFDFLKRKPKSYAGPALPATDLSLEDVQRAAAAPVGTQAAPPTAPSFSETRRAPAVPDIVGTQQKLTVPTETRTSVPASSQGATVFSAKPQPVEEKYDWRKDDFGDIQGMVSPEILMTGNQYFIADAIEHASRELTREGYEKTLDEKNPFLRTIFAVGEGSRQLKNVILGNPVRLLQNITNNVIEPMGYASRPLTLRGKLDALDRAMAKIAPERGPDMKAQRVLEGEFKASQTGGKLWANTAMTFGLSRGSIDMFRGLPIAKNLKAAGPTGIRAKYFMEGLIANAIASSHYTLGEKKKTQDFAKVFTTNIGFFFATATVPGLALATTASFLGNLALGQSKTEAASNTVLGLIGAASIRKELLRDLHTYDIKGTLKGLRAIIDGLVEGGTPENIREAALEEAMSLHAYYQQTHDLKGLAKATDASEKRILKLFAEYKKASPTGERRLIGIGGAMQDGPDGGMRAPDANRAPVDFTKPNKPDIEKVITDWKQKGVGVYELDVPIDKVKGVGELRSAGLEVQPGDTLPPPVGFFDPSTGQVQLVDGNRRLGYFDGKYDTIPVIAIDPKHALKDPAAIAAAGFKTPAPAAAQSAFPSIFNGPPASIPISPKLQQLSIDGTSTTPEKITERDNLGKAIDASKGAIQGGDESKLFATPESAGQQSILDGPPAVPTRQAPTVEAQAQPIKLTEAQQDGVDIYNQLKDDYNPSFRSRAEDGPEFAAAERNAGLAQELVTNTTLRGVLQQETGKSGYAALEKLEVDNLGPFIARLRNRVQNGSPAARDLDDMRARILDDSDGEYGREVLNNMIAKARGEVRPEAKRPSNEEIMEVIDRAVADGRLQMGDDAGNGRTIGQAYERLSAELARKAATPARAITPGPTNDSYANTKLAKNAAKRNATPKGQLTPQQLRDAADEASLTDRDRAAASRSEEYFDDALEETRKWTNAEYNNAVAEAKQLPPEVANKLIARLAEAKSKGRIMSPKDAKIMRVNTLVKLLAEANRQKNVAQRVAAKATADLKKETSIQDRRKAISAIKHHFKLSDASLRKIGGKTDVRYMTESQFTDFVERMKIMAAEEAEIATKRAIVKETIKTKELRKTENYRKALGLPPLTKMNEQQLDTFIAGLEDTLDQDAFLSQRQLETLDNTDMAGVRTEREVREFIARTTGGELKDMPELIITPMDLLRGHTALADRHPFLRLLVDEMNAATLKGEMITLTSEKEVNRLFKAARQSRKRGIIEKLIPTDERIANYLESENKAALAQDMTPEELAAAEYVRDGWEKKRDYLLQQQILTKYIENYMLHMRKDFLETWKTSGIIGAFRTMFKQQKEDKAIFNILSDTGEILPLEKFFSSALFRSGSLDPTHNVARAYMTYERAFQKKIAFDAIMPKFDTFVSVMTPAQHTPAGLEMDRSLKRFYNQWINNEKGRRFDFGGLVPQGGGFDIMLRAGKMLTSMIDLAFSPSIAIANQVGERGANFVPMGAKNYAKGTYRTKTKHGRMIVEKYRNFVGKGPIQSLFEAADNIGNKFIKAAFAMLSDASIRANKHYLLGEMTDLEWKTGEITPERLAIMKREMGRWRVNSNGKSIVGSTSIGSSITQYRNWMVSSGRTTIKNLTTIAKDPKKAFSREGRELLYGAIITAGFYLLGKAVLKDEKDDGIIDEIISKSIRDGMSLVGALDPRVWTKPARQMQFVGDLLLIMQQIVTMEEYKNSKKGEYKKGDSKAAATARKKLMPKAIRQFDNGLGLNLKDLLKPKAKPSSFDGGSFKGSSFKGSSFKDSGGFR